MKSFFKKIVISILTFEARAALARHNPRIVAVTGNVGKTSTKDSIFAVISGVHETRRSEKSFNSEIGLPLAILGLSNAWSSAEGWMKNILKGAGVVLGGRLFPEWLVLEVGADHPGDIEKISKWLHPDIVVLTRMSDTPVHVEFFKNMQEVLREKMFLARALKPGGTLVVNSDDEHFDGAVKELDVKKVFYGTTKGATVEIVENETEYDGTPLGLPVGQYAVLRSAKGETKVELRGVLGNHLMYPVAAAATVAEVLGMWDVLDDAFQDFESPKGRMKILGGKSSSVVIDDTYNSSPLACAEALKTIGRLSTKGRKIGALADMKELGESSERAHRIIGKLAADKLHTLVTVGEAAKYIALGARESGMPPERIFEFADSTAAGSALADLVRAGDVILVKGSQSMRMERVSKALLAEPEKAKELLVRQEKEWERR